MTIRRSNAADNRLAGSLFQRWRDLPIGVRLRVLFSLLILLTLGFALFSIQSTFSSLRREVLDRGQQQQITTLGQSFTRTLDTMNRTALSIANDGNPRLSTYMQALATFTSPNDQTNALKLLSDTLGSLVQHYQDPTIIGLDYVDSAGNRLIHIALSAGKNPVTDLTVTPFTTLPANRYFNNLLAQPVNTAYVIRYQTVLPDGVAFLIGVPVAREGVSIGAYIITMLPTTLSQIGTSALITPGQALALVDDHSQIVVALNDNGDMHLYDQRPYSLNGQIPDAVLADGSALPNVQTYGDMLVSATAIPVETPTGIHNWRVILSSGSTATTLALNRTGTSLVLPLLLIIVFMLVAVLAIERLLISPIRRMTNTARQIASGDYNLRMVVNSQDEIGQLSQSLNAIMRQTAIFSGQLEARVASRTRDIEITAEISREATSIRDVDTLLNKAVNSIREQFGFYHVQVFLVDDANAYAVLNTSTGEAGRALLARNHKLLVGSSSVVGQATQKNQPVVILDTQSPGVTYYPNPLLPDTRAEMALPMRVAGTVIGAIDVQSVRPDAFDDSNIRIFQVLADQLASAVNNARLFSRTQETAQQVLQLNSQLTRKGWRDLTDQHADNDLRYSYDRLNLRPLETKIEALPEANTAVQAPIIVRGETIGRIGALEDPAHPLTTEDREFVRSVANRVALAVENARLTERNQSTINEIELLYKVSRDLSTAPDINTVYELIIAELRQQEVVERIAALRAEPLTATYPQSFSFLRTWARATDGDNSRALPGVRIPAESVFFDPNRDIREPYMIDPQAMPVDKMTASRIQVRDARSMLYLPVAIGNRWFGMLVVQSKRVNAFSERFIRFAQSLADQMAVAMENRQLFLEAQSEARRNRALAEAVQASSQIGTDFEEGVTRLMQIVADSADYDRWWFGRLNGDQQQLDRVTGRAPVGSLLDGLSSISLQTDQSALGEAIYLNAPVLVNEPDHYLFAGLLTPTIESYGKHLAVPVIVGITPMGVLMIGRDFSGDDLDERDLQLANTLSNQLSIVLENQLLFNTTETGRATLQSVLDSQPTGVLVIEADTLNITFSNALSAEILGLDLPEGTRQNLDYRDPSFPTTIVLRTDKPYKIDTRVTLSSSGLTRDLQINAAPIHDNAGKLIGAVAVFTDTTDLRQLEAEVQTNLNETMLLYEANRSISAEATLDGVLHLISLRIHDNLHPAILFVIFQDEQRIQRTVYYSLAEQPDQVIHWERSVGGTALPIPPGLLNENAETNLLLDLHAASASDIPVVNTLQRIRSFPISARNRVVGWLVVGFNTVEDLPSGTRRVLSGLGDQLAIGAESIRLSEQTTNALRETEALYQANRAINGVLNIPNAAEVVREQVMRFKPDRVDIFALAGRNSDRINWLVRWEAQPSVRDTQVIENGYITDLDLLVFEPVFIEDMQQADAEQMEVVSRLAVPEGARAQANIPIRVKENYLGRLILTFNAPRQFSASEQQFLVALAEQTAVVMESAITYQQSQESLDETATLYQASRAITDSVDDMGVLNAIVNYGIPSFISRVMFIRLREKNWDVPNAVADIIGDWSRPEIQTIINLTGIHITEASFPGWALVATADILYIDDIDNAPQVDPDTRALFLSLDIHALVIAPMIVAGRAVGSLLFATPEVHEHSNRELRMFGSLTDQSAIAIENRNLLSQAEARARQILTSSQVGQAATSILNLDELLNRTVSLILASFSYDHVQIFLISADGRDAVLQASTGEAGRHLLESQHSLPVGSSSVIGSVTANNTLSNVHDTQDVRSVHKPNRFLPNTRAELALPLTARGRVLGALDVQSNFPDAFSTEDELILGTLADQIAVAIDNARLFEENQRNIQEIGFLFNVARTAAAVEINVAINRVTGQVLDGTRSDLVALLLTEGDGKRLSSTYAMREAITTFSIPASLPVDTGALATVQRSRQSMLINENAAGMLFTASEVPGLESMVVLPLIVGEKFLGALIVGSLTRFAYTASRVQILETLSSTLSAIIQNAELLRDLQDANARLKEVDVLKSQFLANMSHELRTPLNSIIGFSRIILKGIDGPLTTEQDQDLTTVYDSGRHLLNLVNDILDQAKIEAGKMELAPKFFDVNDLIKAAIATATGLIKDKPIRLHQEIQAKLPQVYADEFRTNQVLLNILSNAAKFTRQGTVTVSAFTIIDGGQQMVQVSVTDTGIGISKENIRRVFAQFEQVDNSTARGAEGTGLGMPIAKSLMEMQGGRIWLESEVGVGSTFSISIPTQPPEIAETPADDLEAGSDPQLTVVSDDGHISTIDNSNRRNSSAVNGKPGSDIEPTAERNPRVVVVIDDAPDMISLYRRYLAKVGYEVVGTTNPEEAAILCITYNPRALLLDVNMPGRSGWEVLQGLKDSDETYRYPVIVCSIEDDKTRGYRLGAADYLVKPFLEEQLINALKRIELERDLPRILLIDDQPTSLRLTREALSVDEDTFRLLEAQGGDQGLAMISSHRPDMVIVDLMMPDVNGFAVVEKIRADADTAHLPILILTGADLSPEEQQRLQAERVQYKSNLSGEALLTCVKEMLAANRPTGTSVTTGD